MEQCSFVSTEFYQGLIPHPNGADQEHGIGREDRRIQIGGRGECRSCCSRAQVGLDEQRDGVGDAILRLRLYSDLIMHGS